MNKLTSRQRKELRSLAHHMDSIVKIGKQGVTDQLIKAIGTALEDHELIKVKFVDHKDEKSAMVPQIAEKCSAEIVGTIGNIIILYKENSDPEKRKIKV
ncbi:MAG TPA: ribosome assembly RNA-binding protein YhbY [Spirochaetota bacterium]|nr:ribosome assembly RNA-binding protein YhbY [Spirochaetota bacterium]